MYASLGVDNIDQLLLPPPPDQPPAMEAGMENSSLMMGAPAQAFIQQNHDAHIQAHIAFTQSPQNQQNPQAASALQAHIQQHQALKYRLRVEEMLAQQGIQLPQPGPDGQLPPLPPEMESQIATAAAQATQEITGQDIALM